MKAPQAQEAALQGIPAVLERHKNVAVKKGKHIPIISGIRGATKHPSPSSLNTVKASCKGVLWGFFYEHKAQGKSPLVLVPSGATPPPRCLVCSALAAPGDQLEGVTTNKLCSPSQTLTVF